jgi:hypothetical protein
MNALRPLLFLSLVSLSVLATCGGGSKEDPVALCKQGCTKYVSLCGDELPEGFTPAQAKALCEGLCTSSTGTGGTQCTNSSAIISAAKACQSKTTCAEYTSCNEALPPCEGGGTGTGGASGTGGRSGTGTGGSSGTGTGGSSGTGTGGASGGGTACAELLACCNATTNATLKGVCMSQYSVVMSMGNDVCMQALDAIKSTYCP